MGALALLRIGKRGAGGFLDALLRKRGALGARILQKVYRQSVVFFWEFDGEYEGYCRKAL